VKGIQGDGRAMKKSRGLREALQERGVGEGQKLKRFETDDVMGQGMV
jgi:hypothetical protein